MKLIVSLTGFLMAMADSVPGVSGGTIAFILGVYQELIDSIKNVVYKEKRAESIKFLINIFSGWIIGFVLAIFILTSLFETHIYLLSSIFIGFIFISIPLTMKDDKKEMLDNKHHVLFTFIGMAAVVTITFLGSHIDIDANSVPSTISFFGYLYIFISGALGISCMLLPGISGSTMLMITGIYFLIINSVKSFLTLDFSVFPILFVFGMGMLVGGFFIVRIISHAYKNYRSQTIYCIEGLMIGSLYAISMGPTSLDLAPLSTSTFSIIGFIIGATLILLLEQLKTKK